MFGWIIGTSLQLRALVVGVAAALVIFGTFQLRSMPVDAFPEFALPVVEVQTEALGLSAEEVEALITLNLEELMSGVPWLKSVRSESVTGLSSIVLTFQRGTDLYEARQMVQERLALVYALPNVSEAPTLLQPLSATSRFMMVGLTSQQVEETELSLLARWTIKPKLIGVPGVANVAIWGSRVRELQVQVDPQRLRDAGLGQDDVIQAAGDALWITPLSFLRGSSPGTGGFIDNANQRLGVHHKMPIFEPEDMAKVAVTPQHVLKTGKRMELGDIAEVTYSHPMMIGDALVGDGANLLLVIEKFPSANTLEVTRGVEQALEELGRGLPGVKIDANVFRLATYIDASISNLTSTIIFGAVLVVFVIGAFLFNWRGAIISVVSIPVSLLTAVLILGYFDATLNLMILAGLVVGLGVVIDDAIVDVEKIMGRLRERREDGPSISLIIFETTLETRSATIYAALVVLMAVSPIFFMGSISGAFFKPLAMAYVLAVLASLVVGMSLTPALSLMLFGGSKPSQIPESPIAVGLREAYGAILQRLMKAPTVAMVGGGALLAAGLAVWPLLGQSLLPALQERDVVVNWSTPPGTSRKETTRITARAIEELKALPGVRGVNAHVGRAITGDQVVGINAAQIWVGLDEDASLEDMVDRIRNTVDGYPGVDRSVQAYLRDTISEVLSGVSMPIVVRIFGQERGILREKAEEVRQELSSVNGLVDPRTLGDVQEPQVRVKVNLEAAANAGVKPGEVRRAAATVFSGLNVGFLFEEQKIFDVVVWSPPEVRQSLNDLEDVLVETTDGQYVRLADVADVSILSVPSVIRHAGVLPYIDVVANVNGRDVGSVTEEVESRLDNVEFPQEYFPEVLGEYAERKGVERQILGVSVAALIGIFLLLQACFRSWRLGLIGFLALPVSVAGGLLAVLVTGGMVSLGSIVGFFAVLGIAARNGILLITHYQHLEVDEGVPFNLDLVIRGAQERLSPILASFAAIIAALLPMGLVGLVPGLEIVQSTAIVIIGGLVASILATLFVIPVLYSIFGSGANRQHDLGLAEA